MAFTGMGDHLQSGKSPGQLSLLPSAGQEMSTSQSVVTLCSWGVEAGINVIVSIISFFMANGSI